VVYIFFFPAETEVKVMDEESEEKYRNAQAAHQRFFGIESKYEFKIKDFLAVYSHNPTYLIPQPLPDINLTGVPSRSRITLIAKLTKEIREKTTVTYLVDRQKFICEHNPSVQQPGNIHLTGIGSYNPDGIPIEMASISERIRPSTIVRLTRNSRKTGRLVTGHLIASECGCHYQVLFSFIPLMSYDLSN
jgi:hypothetical protein